MIELKNIGRSYFLGNTELKVLQEVNLEIHEGEFVAIMGPSGSGKSTLMQILGLLDRPTYGTYRLLGKDVSKLSDDEGAALRSRSIGFIFQMFNLLPRTSALQNVAMPLIYAGVEHRLDRARELLTQVGLADRLSHNPNELSGGQQQRVAIARALVGHPKIIFADEPTGNLASDQADEILAYLQKMNDTGISVIMVTHEPDIAAHARRIIHIKDGRIVGDEKTRETKKKTKLPSVPEVRLLTSSLAVRWAEFKEFFATAWRGITSNKTRSVLSVLGILIGVASVVTMLAIGRGAEMAIRARLSSLGTNLLYLRPGAPSMFGVHGAQGSTSRLTLADLDALKRASSSIKSVDGNVSGAAQVVYKDQNANTQVTGVLPVYETMRASTPYYGRFFTDQENTAQARVALLGQTVVNELYGQENPVGTEVKINHINFRVIGILPAKGSQGPRDQDDTIIMPLATAMNRVVGNKYLNSLSIECTSMESMPEATEAIRTLMRKRHRLPAYKDDDFDIRNMAEMQQAMVSTTQTITMLLGMVAAISLLVGGIGIMNIMLVSVTERTREIGLRKAVGAPRRAILWQFLMESAVLSVGGGLLGVMLGGLLSFLLTTFAGWTAVLTVPSILLAFVFSAGIGIVFGFWPARKASLLSPIEALRYE
ncbi:MAG: ATP-binding cassette domain-containing protein [Candidatus Firestonebacteria bacterium]|nr:ATP-binding cassette domain-containing protein [Candidatus Firestonebacteria bacterium]